MSEVQNVIDEICTSSNIEKSSKNDIDRLLLSLKDETNQLSELRSKSKSNQFNNDQNNDALFEKNDLKSITGTYSNRLKEYYQKRKQDEEKESEERMMRYNYNCNYLFDDFNN